MWKDVSLEARDLVTNMTLSDQYERYSVENCLKHEWMKMPVHSTTLLASALTKIKRSTVEQLSQVFLPERPIRIGIAEKKGH